MAEENQGIEKDDKDIERILSEINNLEIEGVTENEYAAQYYGFFNPRSPEKKAVYVISADSDDSGGNSYRNINFIQFLRSDLEKLIKHALESPKKEAEGLLIGCRRRYYDSGDINPIIRDESYDIELRISMKLEEGKPIVKLDIDL